ncbi:MAG TPA: EamA family transporter [Firmicutes bacterium]|jgi:drug/metabolite transporter (DMT)-like permease|nr:EamA family transporter [Bacillota bacterium]
MQKKKTAYLYLIITTCAWGSLYVVGKFVLGKVPPFTVLFFRYLVAGIALFPVLKARKRVKIERADYKYIFLMGFLGYFLSIGAQLMGTKLSNASLASLINSMNPVFIILFAVFILKEKLTFQKVIAVIATIVGTYIILGGGSETHQWLGIVISFISVITWSLMSVLVRKITQKYDSLMITAYGMLIAMVLTLPVAGCEMFLTPHVQLFNRDVILSLLYMGLVCTALSHFLWNTSLSMIEAGTCSLFYPLQPMVSVLLGGVFLSERLNSKFVIGAVLIVGGVLVGLIGKRSKEG